MSLCPSLSLNFFLKNQLCSRTTLLRLVSVLSSMLRWSCKYQREGSEYWEQKVLSVFTCSCHQRKLCQPLFAVTHEDTHIDHLDQWNENNRSCDLISIDQLETSAYLISVNIFQAAGTWVRDTKVLQTRLVLKRPLGVMGLLFIHSL